MTPVQTVFAICRFLERALEDIRPQGEEGAERKITVYPFNLPDPSGAQMREGADDEAADSYEGMMPAVVVAPISFEDKAFEDGSALLAVSIMPNVFSDDPKNREGPWAVLNILEWIRRLLLTQRILEEACEVQGPLSYQIFDDSLKPIWAGEMLTQWRIGVPARIDCEDWRGDFINKGGTRFVRKEDRAAENSGNGNE